MCDLDIAQSIGLIKGGDTLIVLVIQVEIIRSQYEEIVVSCTDIL